MPTLNISVDLTAEAYERAIALSPAERERMVANMFSTARNEQSDSERDELPDEELTPEDLASIGRGFDDMDAGRVHDGEQVFAEMRERFGWKK